MTYLRKSTIVPKVTFVREAIADESKFALLYVLLDWVEEFLLGDLQWVSIESRVLSYTYLLLRVRPARNFNYHVEHGLLDSPYVRANLWVNLWT